MAQEVQTQLDQIVAGTKGLQIKDALAFLEKQFPGQVTFSTSFSFEDQLITHEIAANSIPISIFTLDTGRLFAETYSVWSSTREKYNANIKAYYPDQSHL